jgi:hypothetical protein
MPFIIVNRERFALPIGETRVGGIGEDALPFPELARVETAAIVSVLPDGTASLRSTGQTTVALNGQALGAAAAPLTHGARIDVAGLRLVFGDLRDVGTTAHVRGITDENGALLGVDITGETTADSGGRLTALGTGRVIEIPEAGLVIGRDPECDVVIPAKNVSRRHASIRPSIRGYLLTDLGANGTFVNGRRVEAAQVLGMRDVIRIGDEQFQFEADAGSLEPAAGLRTPSTPPAGVPVLRPTPASATGAEGPSVATARAMAAAIEGTRVFMSDLLLVHAKGDHRPSMNRSAQTGVAGMCIPSHGLLPFLTEQPSIVECRHGRRGKAPARAVGGPRRFALRREAPITDG